MDGIALEIDRSEIVPPIDPRILVEARAYIAQVRWQFAKTMPAWPHEYTIKAWRPDLAGAFEALCQLITSRGYVEPWPPAPQAPQAPIYHNHYFLIGDHKYWAMGPLGDADALQQKTVLNRAAQPAPAL